MKKQGIGAAWRSAWQSWKSQFPGMLLTTMFQLIVRLFALSPLLFLAVGHPNWVHYLTRPAENLLRNGWRFLFLLSPAFYLLLVVPLRQNAAEAMQGALDGAPVFSVKLVSGGASYAQKLVRGLRTTIFMVLWTVPLFGLITWTAQQFAGDEAGLTDGFTQMRKLTEFGGGNIERGVIYALLIVLGALLVICIGCAFHSGRRHEWALGGERLVPGRRGRVMLAWLAGLGAFVPFLLVVVPCLASYLAEALRSLKSLSLKLPPVDFRIWLSIAAVPLLFFPAVSLSRMVTAAFVRNLKGEAP